MAHIRLSRKSAFGLLAFTTLMILAGVLSSLAHADTLTITSKKSLSTRALKLDVVKKIEHKVLPHDASQKARVEREAIAKDVASHVAFTVNAVARKRHRVLVYHVHVSKNDVKKLSQAIVSEAKTGPWLNINKVEASGSATDSNDFVVQSTRESHISQADLVDTLYALSQEPGFSRVDALLLPSPVDPLSSTLAEHITPAPRLAGSYLDLNNYGYAATGAVTLSGLLSVSHAITRADQATVAFSVSPGGLPLGMGSLTASYMLTPTLMTHVGADTSVMTYNLNQGFSPWGHGASAGALAALGVSGDNYSGDLWTSQNLLMKSDRKIVVKELAFLRAFTDTYSQTVQNSRVIAGGTVDLSASRNIGKIYLSGDLSDTEYSLSQGAGSSPANPFYYDTQGLQNYFQGNAQAVYVFNPTYSVTLGTIDQQYIGGGTLDPMLQGTLGGVYTIMALPTASLFGNDMYVGTLTFTRSDMTKKGLFQSSLFFDAGQVTGIGTNYAAMGPGVEESWSLNHYFAKADVAVPVGALPTQSLGTTITALTGGNIGQGGIPLQLWLSAGIRY